MGENIDFKEILSTYTKHWQWFVLFGFVSIVLATIYLRYVTPQYQSVAKIQILDENDSGVNIFEESGLLSFGKNNILDEIEILHARSNFIEIVEKLKLNTMVSEQGNIRSREIYTNRPIAINFIADDSIINKTNYSFYITLSSETEYSFSEEEDKGGVKHNYGSPIESPIGSILITPNLDVFDNYLGRKLKIDIVPVDVMADYYQRQVEISNADEKSNIVSLVLKDPVPQKAADVLNELVNIYNVNAIDDKKLIADRTRDFINERISDISTNLTSVDASAEDLRTSRGITDIKSETNINLNVRANNSRELANAQNQLNIAEGVREIVVQQKGKYEVLPENLLPDPSVASTTSKYNQLVNERDRLLKSSNEKNPVIVNLDQQLDALKTSLSSSLNNTVNNLGLTVNTLSGQQAILNSRIYSAPTKERELRDITRRQQTTEELYLYLLQKREEAQIAVASTAPKSKTIDLARPNARFPVSPRKNIVYLAALIFGLFIPFSVIYTRDLLDNKVHNMKSLEKITRNVPILGELPKLTKKQLKTFINDERSVLSESLRIFRTNLDYLIKTNQTPVHKNNIVFVSSSISGEGKTFVSSNLSLILASAQKKVLLLGADVRNPKIFDFFAFDRPKNKKEKQQRRGLGLTDYLFDDTVQVSQIVNEIHVNSHKIDVIYSGKIPPNPAELLLSPKVGNLINDMSAKYDYVIVDTAPLMVVTDTLLISQFADHLIYVTRAEVTENKAIDFPIKLQEEGKIKGLAFVVNDVVNSNLGYGGMYGYGYGRTKKKWWKLYH